MERLIGLGQRDVKHATWSTCPKKEGETWHKCMGNQNTEGARQIADHLDKIPHSTYVEPFLGLGHVYRARTNHPEKEVLNDIDCNRTDSAKQRTCSKPTAPKCEYLNKAELTCGRDYTEVIKKYDTPNTLIYLDPPYDTKNKGRYQSNNVDFGSFVNTVKSIKNANVAVSYSDNPDFKKEFCSTDSGYKCHKIKRHMFNTTWDNILAIKNG